MITAQLVYVLCTLTSLLASALLWNSFRRTGFRLLFWSTLCFLGLALNNALVFVDLVLLPQTDLALVRVLPAVLGVAAMVFGFVWETV